jgi:hypothetical protein
MMDDRRAAMRVASAEYRDVTREAAQRARRLAELVDMIAAANRPLTPGMPEGNFRAMVLRMAEHQLLYEEYGHLSG